ncbi:MAG: hypothetical protein ACKVQS_09500 [Fimbriimonadaceae bacterium]
MVCNFVVAALILSAELDQERISVGILGQSIEECKIYSSMDENSKILWHLKAYQDIIINKTMSEKWYGVLLQNGKTGFILKKSVAEFPYEVELPKNYKFHEKSLETERASRILPRSEINLAYLTGTYRTEKREVEEMLPNASKEEVDLLLNKFVFKSNRTFTATMSGDKFSGTFSFNGKESRLFLTVTHANGKKLYNSQLVAGFVKTNGKRKFVHLTGVDVWLEKY